MKLENKIDFALVFTVEGANPNGDPLNENRPRQRFDGRGEMSDVAIKRKIRNAVQDKGVSILVQMNGNETDEFRSIKGRLEGNEEIKKALKEGKKAEGIVTKLACEEWFDVRAFGQLMAFNKGKKDSDKGEKAEKGISIGVRGPVSIRTATSVDPILVNEMQITKSVNGVDDEKKGPDTMGMKYSIDFAVYVLYGSISPQLAEKTGFSKEDADILKEALVNIFENDISSARPAGSMEVRRLCWWEHNGKVGNSAKVHRSLRITSNVEEPTCFEDYTIENDEVVGVTTEIQEF